ncbi:MAG: polysaccharide deacetylase family protein, partial [Candidatus Saccharicenans sp.]|nr:polysaccharide deacetylase family protein [Candidatus Saccharicenans sp.]
MARQQVRKRVVVLPIPLVLALLLFFLAEFIAAQDLTLEQGGIIRGPRDQKKLALVFTADSFGEGAEYILSELWKRHLKGSFFLTGNFLRQPEFRPWIEKMVEAGHYLGPHSDRHLLYCDWQDRQKTLVQKDEFLADLDKNYQELEKFGVTRARARFFMPPYEWYNWEIAGWAAEAEAVVVNFTPGLLTNSDYISPDLPGYRSSEEILEQLLEYEKESPAGLNGFIILVHLGVAVERTDLFYFRVGELIEELSARGYTLVRIDELLSPADLELEKNGKKAANQMAGGEPAIQPAPVQITGKSEGTIKESRMKADNVGSAQAAGKQSRNGTLVRERRGEEVGPAPEELFKFSLTRAWVNFARGRVRYLVPSSDNLFWSHENRPPAYELLEVRSGKKQAVGLLEMNLEQNPVPGKTGFWVSSGQKLFGLSFSGIIAGPQVELVEPLAGTPVVSENWLLLPFKNGLEARSTETGELLWHKELPAEFSRPLIISGSEVLVPCLSGQLLRFDLKTGRKIG